MPQHEILNKIKSIKQRVEQVKNLPFTLMMQKAQRVEGIVTDAVFVIEQMAQEQQRLEQLLDDLLTNGTQRAG